MITNINGTEVKATDILKAIKLYEIVHSFDEDSYLNEDVRAFINSVLDIINIGESEYILDAHRLIHNTRYSKIHSQAYCAIMVYSEYMCMSTMINNLTDSELEMYEHAASIIDGATAIKRSNKNLRALREALLEVCKKYDENEYIKRNCDYMLILFAKGIYEAIREYMYMLRLNEFEYGETTYTEIINAYIENGGE